MYSRRLHERQGVDQKPSCTCESADGSFGCKMLGTHLKAQPMMDLTRERSLKMVRKEKRRRWHAGTTTAAREPQVYAPLLAQVLPLVKILASPHPLLANTPLSRVRLSTSTFVSVSCCSS